MERFSVALTDEVKEFCREYYDKYVFGLPSENWQEELSIADAAFSSIEPRKFNLEFVCLRLELFALAWVHRFGMDYTYSLEEFTKRYLGDKSSADIWNEMEHYNVAVSQATLMQDRSILTKRADLADKAIEEIEGKGLELNESVGRPINRMYSDSAWANGKTDHFLMLAFCHKLGLGYGPKYHGPKEKASLTLVMNIRAFYKATMSELDKLRT